MVADWLAGLERTLAEGDEAELAVALVSLAFVAGETIVIPEDERRPSARRALLLLAAGGDPSRGLDLEGRAVGAVADELDSPGRRRELLDGLARLAALAPELPHVSAAVSGLAAAPDVAWRAYAASVLADELMAEPGETPSDG